MEVFNGSSAVLCCAVLVACSLDQNQSISIQDVIEMADRCGVERIEVVDPVLYPNALHVSSIAEAEAIINSFKNSAVTITGDVQDVSSRSFSGVKMASIPDLTITKNISVNYSGDTRTIYRGSSLVTERYFSSSGSPNSWITGFVFCLSYSQSGSYSSISSDGLYLSASAWGPLSFVVIIKDIGTLISTTYSISASWSNP